MGSITDGLNEAPEELDEERSQWLKGQEAVKRWREMPVRSTKMTRGRTTGAGRLFAFLDRCPHPNRQAADALIRWGSCQRQAHTGLYVYQIRVQRIPCKACGRTHSPRPDFLHP
jgi:hypothetical protein